MCARGNDQLLQCLPASFHSLEAACQHCRTGVGSLSPDHCVRVWGLGLGQTGFFLKTSQVLVWSWSRPPHASVWSRPRRSRVMTSSWSRLVRLDCNPGALQRNAPSTVSVWPWSSHSLPPADWCDADRGRRRRRRLNNRPTCTRGL